MLVSCLFDLGKYEPRHRAAHTYLHLASQFLFKQQDFPVIVFCDPELVPHIQRKNVTAIAFDLLKQAPHDVKKIQRCIEEGRCNKDRGKTKDTALYHLVGWLKPLLLQRALRHSPDYNFYCWIDIGINHVASTDNWPASLCQPKWSPNHIQLLCLNPPLYVSRIQDFIEHRRYTVGGGFWVVPKALVNVLAAEFDHVLGLIFRTMDFVTLEDELLGLLTCLKTDLFRFHYGDYQDILNLDYPRHQASVQLVTRNVLGCQDLSRCIAMYQALCENPAFSRNETRLALNRRLIGSGRPVRVI